MLGVAKNTQQGGKTWQRKRQICHVELQIALKVRKDRLKPRRADLAEQLFLVILSPSPVVYG